MKQAPAILFLILLLGILCKAQDKPGLSYPVDPAQQIHPEMPKGEMLQFDFNNSKIFPGTNRTIWVYVPAQYQPNKPACIYVDMDGVQFNAPTVFDYLIYKGEMPVTIGVFISSGTVMKSDKEATRYNRSHEFDSMNNDFVNFLLNELLPEVEKKKTADGRVLNISNDPNDRALAGASSGAICAFTAAWERPDIFSRVYSSIGTYVSMRGGDQYPGLIRKTEPKPIRIFLQDGSNDAWNPLFGSWFASNLNMEAALSFAGYEVAHSWGNGGHDGVQATAIFPDVMRWLWKGWPQKVQAGKTNNNMLADILPEGEAWQQVHTPLNVISITSAPGGKILLQDSSGWINEVGVSDKIKPVIKIEAGAIACDSAGNIDVIKSNGSGLFSITANGKRRMILKNITGKKLLITNTGNMYITKPAFNQNDHGELLLVKPGSKMTVVDEGVRFASAIAISPDRSMLFVAEDNTNWIYSYVIKNDGSLKYKERWYWLHQTDNYGYSQISDLAIDNEGNLYAATNMGIQVNDQNGRVRAILQLPYGPVTGLCFGGANFDTLFVICNGKLYKRKLKVEGIPSWTVPQQPQSIGAG